MFVDNQMIRNLSRAICRTNCVYILNIFIFLNAYFNFFCIFALEIFLLTREVLKYL